jgi:hypothetical protein
MTQVELEKIVKIAEAVLPGIISFITSIVDMIKGSDIPEATKEELIARIKAAQASVPEWT